ncbi:MAG TPA: GyrI-like domain-containing protein [Candidatus Binatia bacterium]|nr:GyrI-like domain-containing protein [Candidatus Binatia bacterium]
MTTTPSAADLRGRLAPLYAPPREPVLVDIPELGWLMVDGTGSPAGEGAAEPTGFQQAIGALYPVLYTLKFRLKRTGTVVPVLPLEALWFTADDGSFDVSAPAAAWRWRALIAVPDGITLGLVEETVSEVRRKRGSFPALESVRWERWREGRAAQVMHVGPYREEAPTIQRLHAFIAAQGLRPRGAHHEIYLGDPRRSAPERLRTVLRQPVSED